MKLEEAIVVVKVLAGLRGFPRGDAATGTLAECATILEDSCQDATQANQLVVAFTPPRWPGVAAFRRHAETWGGDAQNIQLAALGRQFRPVQPGSPVEYLPGFELPAWVFPAGASDATIGRNVMKFGDELHATALRTINKLEPKRRAALMEFAHAGALVDISPAQPGDNQERFDAAKTYRATLYMLEIQGWAKRDGVEWRRFFWHYIDCQKWISEVGQPGMRRPYPTRPTSTK